ncbi:MAG: hypothetical protein IJA69_04420, partial [Clostridia bacterium]|nr:hypothetical protein [Clostridia bacterium]
MIYKKKNKFLISYLCTICAFVLLCSFLFFVEVEKTDSWQNYANFDFEIEKTVNENGNEVITNLISTPEQLAGMFYRINNSVSADDYSTGTSLIEQNYRLTNGIDLSGKSWTCSSLPANYVFDGGFNTISNLTISASSGENVGFISECLGTIQNVVFDNVNVYYSNVNKHVKLGAVAGNVGASGKISNVTVTSGKVECIKNTETQSRNVAGVAGRLSGGTIEKCINHASVINGGHTGGIVGYVNSNSKIANCFNYGDISTDAYNCVRMGGIAGEIASNGGTISLCYNEGDITAYNSEYVAGADIAIGGIVGYCYVKVEKCQNYGNVTAGNDNTNTVNAGGVVGRTSGVVSNCSNSGTITAAALETSSVIDSVLMESCNRSIPMGTLASSSAYKSYAFFSISNRSYTLSDLYEKA